ncbi:MAG: ABC transporter ATP-binding protein [Solirubrobacteraceae bacterium]
MTRPDALSGPHGIAQAGAVSSTAPALRLTGITKRFGPVVANRDVSLEVMPGEIHALLGENGAGKTTLMRVAAGVYQPDQGQIEVHGRPVKLRKSEHALEAGVGMVHQHFTLVPTLTVAENVALRPARFPRPTDLDAVVRSTVELSRDIGFDLDPHMQVAEASISERQRLEIVKLLYRGADILIFDEPSAALSPAEWEELARLLRRLASEGRAIVLITHKIDEILQVADRFTVLRDGVVSGEGNIAETNRDQLVEFMVGRAVKLRPDRLRLPPGEPVLAVEGLTVPAAAGTHGGRPDLEDVTFDVRGCEVVAVAGVAGSGQSALVDALLGLRSASAGTVALGGQEYEDRSPGEFAVRGGAYIPEDRHHAGVADELTVWENILMRDAVHAPIASRGVLRASAARRRAAELMETYDVRASGPTAVMRQLSGGNQQKAVIARELSRAPRLVLAVQPTRGLDVRASEFVYEQLLEVKRAGGAVLLISFDLEEILGLADRVAVLADGALAGVLDIDQADVHSIGALMTKSRGA